MTKAFAENEAQRRTDAIGSAHYVYRVYGASETDGYIVTARVLDNAKLVNSFPLKQVHCDSCLMMVNRDHRCGPNNSI
jgi:hypothetical protein